MEKKYILFDLDGTLTDPKEGITKSVRHALSAFRIEVEDLDSLCCFIGPPLKDSFMEYYQFGEEAAAAAVEKYREYFSVRGLYENQEYPGIEDLLRSLKEAGKKLYVATSKPEFFARQILEHFRLDSWFEFIGGANMDETRVKKGEVIRYVLEENGIRDLDRAVMVGDRRHDIEGAREAGLEAVGVLYGYGSREELERAGADRIAKDLTHLSDCLLNW